MSDGLNEAEVNSLRLAKVLVGGEGQTELAVRFAGQSLVGQADELWQLLLQWQTEPKSAPAARYASELVASPRLADSPIVTYYAGVVALRKGTRARRCRSGGNLPAADADLALVSRKQRTAPA